MSDQDLTMYVIQVEMSLKDPCEIFRCVSVRVGVYVSFRNRRSVCLHEACEECRGIRSIRSV